MSRAVVTPFFDPVSHTFSYVVEDPTSSACAIIDSVLDFDYSSGQIDTSSADKICDFILTNDLSVSWILETHMHADHLSAAAWLHKRLGGRIGVGARISEVQKTFGKIFNAGTEFRSDGDQFDALFHDNDSFSIGTLKCKVWHTPGHTPACVTYLVDDAAFVGDTLFMPDYGSARCDFPGGCPRTLYRSIQRIFSLPASTRMFMCHDYKAPGRDTYEYTTTVEAQKARNIHVGGSTTEDEFVAMRSARDSTLGMPKLLLPSVQINMRGGRLPPSESNGETYLKIPIRVKAGRSICEARR